LAQVAGGLNQMLDALDQAEGEVRQRQQREAKLREEMRRQESQAALGRFSAGVAHELGAPLTVIQTDVQRLRPACAGDAQAGRRLDRITDQLRRTRQLVGQLMSLVRDPEVEPARSDLNEIVQRAVNGARPQAESRNVQLAFEPAAAIIVPALPIRVEHAVLNLLRNAVQAAQSRVEVSVDHDDNCGTVTVEDDGPGMDVEQSSQVFEPFHTGREEGEGTGLGLTIVRAVAELHGGSVRVGTSRHLGGCSFELRLPSGGRT
ncbi:MAG: sensor histidine kinase, partial [Wenzhouxiangellaceae bacterium]